MPAMCRATRSQITQLHYVSHLGIMGEKYVIFSVLKPAGYVMHHQFNIQQLYALPTLYLYVLYLSENKQRLVPLMS
jgi:hypothetical protein